MPNYPITKTWYDERDFNAIIQPLKSGWVVQGPKVEEFENHVSKYTNTRHAVAVSNGTTALHILLLASGIGPGDEVILPSYTYIASANAVEYCGAIPVFIDINLNTFNIAPEDIEQKITKKTKAVLAVSLFGLAADLNSLWEICKKHNLKLIEDAACALGSTINNISSGNWGVGAIFSFHPRKVISTGEGGMIVTNDDEINKKARILRNQGMEPGNVGSQLPKFKIKGFNYRMTDIQGALGITQMAKLEKIIQGRKQGAEWYLEYLKDVPEIQLPQSPKNFGHSYQSFVILVGKKPPNQIIFNEIDNIATKRNSIMNFLEKNGITVRQGTHAIHALDYYSQKYNIKLSLCPNSYLADRLSIALPLYFDISIEDIKYISNKLKEAIKIYL